MQQANLLRYLKQRMWLIVLVLVILGGTVGLIVVGSQKTIVSQHAPVSPTPVPPNVSLTQQMRPYQDPDRYYTIAVPFSWQIKRTVATETTGLKTKHPLTRNIEIVQFFSVQDGLGVTVQVAEGKPSCPTRKPTTTLAGLPAFYDPLHRMWIMPTPTATYMVNYHDPSQTVFHRPPNAPTPTPVLSQLLQQEQFLLKHIITTSFHPTHTESFSC